MNAYIELSGKKYRTPAKYWQPIIAKPATVRHTLAGNIDATYGPMYVVEWRGMIEGPIATESGWGTISDLRSVLQTPGEVQFRDHFGTLYGVHIIGPFQERSLMNMHDAPSNKIYVSVRIVKGRVITE